MSNARILREIASFKPTLNAAQHSSAPNVFIVDADNSVRNEITALVHRSGWCAEGFASARSFLARCVTSGPCCLVLELTPPDLCGLEVLRRIKAERVEMPVIFITDRNDLRTTVQAMKAGGVELLFKPIDQEALMEAVRGALKASEKALAIAAETSSLQARYASLSRREREVMGLVVTGLLNKQVGGKLGICEITVKAHRGQVMRKMQARTLVDLVHMSTKLEALGPNAQVARFF
jgi:FixJ family two-component response regulator